MSGQQAPEDTDGDFKHLRSCIHIERDGLDNVLDRGIESLNIADHHKSIEDVNKS